MGVGDDVHLLAGVVQSARRLLDLDADPEAIDAALAADRAPLPLVRRAPARLPGTTDGFELAVRAIVGQQVSVAGARTTLGRIAERFGEPLQTPSGTIVRLFPTPDRLARGPRDAFGMPRTRADAIRALAEAAARGDLGLSGSAELAPTLEHCSRSAASGSGPPPTSRCARCAAPTRSRPVTSGCDAGSKRWGFPTTCGRSGSVRSGGGPGERTPPCISGRRAADRRAHG